MADDAVSEAASHFLPRIPGWVVVGFFLGVVGTVVVWIIVTALANRGTLAVLTAEDLDAAELRWLDRGPPSYKLEVRLEGARQGSIVVEVREGEVTAMTIDGRPPSQRRTWDAWSVPGQFDMIHRDLENAADRPQEAFGVRERGQVTLRAEFDEQYGYPLHYERLVSGGAGEIRWSVTKFEVLP